MKEFAFASISDLQKALQEKHISAPELLEFFLKRFADCDGDLGTALEVFDKDSIIKASANQGILHGIPGLIKDNISQQSRKLTCASKILEGLEATFDATAVARLKQEGAYLLGRANMDEFAMGSSTETSAYQLTRNPWDHERVPGGSSGGSIAAVAAGLVPWALGSETGGSVRQPAALCGIVGLKPTYGLVSRNGLVAYGSSMDQIGIATRTVYDNALVLSVIAGHDVKDSSSLFVDRKDYTAKLDGKLPEKIKIGVIDNALHAEGIDAEVVSSIEDAIAELERQGAIVQRVSMPVLDYAAAVYFILSRAEAASNLARFDGVKYGLRAQQANSLADMYEHTRQEGFGKEVKARIMIGNYVLSAGHASDFYGNAKKVQRLLQYEFNRIFKTVDILVAPTAPGVAFKFGAFADNHLQMDLQDYFTCAMNIAGIPAISLPCGLTSQEMPVGFQLIGPHLSESLLFQVGHAYQQVTSWHTLHPKGYEVL